MPARPRVPVPVQFEAGGHVLGDGVVQPADLPQGRDAYDVVGADEHGGAVTVAGALDEGVEEELLGFGRLGDRGDVVPVHLRSDDEGDVRVAEVPQHPLQELGERHVVGVDGGEELVLLAVPGDPRVVVAVLGTGLVGALRPVPLGYAPAGEVPDAEFRAERLRPVVVTLVEEPDVEVAVVADPRRALQGGPDHGEGFLARDVGGEEGDAGAGFGDDRYGIARDHRRVGDRRHVDHHEQLDQPDGRQHRDVEPDEPGVPALTLHPVRGPDQIDEQAAGQQRRQRHQQHGPYSMRLPREKPAVFHLVRRSRGLRERPGESAVAVVVVHLRPHGALH